MSKTLSRTVLSLVLVFVLALTLSPEVARWKLTGILAEQGIEARIGHLGISLRKGEVSLSNVHIRQGDELELDLAYAEIRIDLMALGEDRLVIENLSALKLKAKMDNTLSLTVDAMSLVDAPIIMSMREGQTPNIHTEGRFVIDDIRLSAENAQAFSIDRFELNQAHIQDTALSLGSLNFEGVELYLETRQGDTAPMPEVLAILFAGEDTNKRNTPDNKAESNTPSVKIGKISIDKNSQIHLLDHTHEPLTQIDFGNFSFSIADIDTNLSAASSPFTLNTKVGEYGGVEANGDISILSEKTNLSLSGKISAIDLPEFSSYLHQPLAHQITSGQLNSDLEISIKENELEGHAELDLQKFYLDKLSKDARPEDSDPNLMPIGTALNLLRDGDDRIEFRLPMTGDIADPEFSPTHILGIVARKALTEAVINYYTPLGLVSVAGALVDSATTLRFPPVLYQAGAISYTEDPKDTLKKVSDLLNVRKSIIITLCSQSSLLDHGQLHGKKPASDSQILKLVDLAKQRAKVMKQTLIEQGIAPERIISCKAAYDKTLDTSGQVTIEL